MNFSSSSAAAPKRALAYMAGRTTTTFLPLIQKMITQLGSQLEEFTFVIGDLHHYRWARSQPLDSRIKLLYQHENFNPFQQPPQPDMKRLALFEEKYGAPHLWRYVLAQQIIRGLSYEAKCAYLQSYLEYFDSLFQRIQPDLLLTGNPDSLPFLIAHEVFKRNGVLTLVLAPSRIPGRFHVIDNEMEQIPHLSENYQALKNQPLTEDERLLAADVRSAYQKRLRPSYFRRGPRLRALPSPIKMIRSQWQRFRRQDWYFEVRPMDNVRNGLACRFRWPFQRFDMKRLTSSCPSDGRFFYYPLQYEPEFSIDVLGTSCLDQLQVIQRISAALPAGYLLCLKEHPNMFPGRRPLGFYRKVVRLGNVRLMDSLIDGYDLIEKCRGVITISGTAGFEALFYGKPVLLFGQAFYQSFPDGVFQAGSYEQLAQVLGEMTSFPGFDPGHLDRFVVELCKRSYPGAFEDTLPEMTNPQNPLAIAQGVLSELRFRLS